MRRTVKRESEATSDKSRKRETDDKTEQLRSVKKMKQAENGDCSNGHDETHPTQEEEEQGISDRRILRSQYLALQNRISDSKDDLMKIDSDKFSRIIKEVENLHQHVRKPREQIADAEALLDIANTLMSSVKSQSSTHGVSPAEFVNALLSGFGQGSLGIDETAQVSINWKDLGFNVSSAVLIPCGCSTMLGPIDTEPKQRKKAANRKRVRLGEGVRPDEVDDTESEEKTDTDKNMAIMFEILRQKKRVKIESLVLNRRSFAQTVENLFALSFLAKDGRVEIIVDQSGSHFALPRNAPATNLVMTGEVIYNHFVFRFDFKDWKMMSEMVPIGEELMPHREIACPSASADCRQDSQTTPIRKLSRNRGLVVHEETVVDDSPDIKEGGTRRRCKQRLTSS